MSELRGPMKHDSHDICGLLPQKSSSVLPLYCTSNSDSGPLLMVASKLSSYLQADRS